MYRHTSTRTITDSLRATSRHAAGTSARPHAVTLSATPVTRHPLRQRCLLLAALLLRRLCVGDRAPADADQPPGPRTLIRAETGPAGPRGSEGPLCDAPGVRAEAEGAHRDAVHTGGPPLVGPGESLPAARSEASADLPIARLPVGDLGRWIRCHDSDGSDCASL